MQIAAGNEGRCRFRFNRAETFFLHHRDSGFEGVTLVNLTRGSSDLKSFTASLRILNAVPVRSSGRNFRIPISVYTEISSMINEYRRKKKREKFHF